VCTVPGLIVTFGLVGGVLAALGKVQLAAIFVGLVLAGLVVASRKAIFWFVLVAAVVVTGVAQLYFPEAKLVRYVVPAASLAFLLHWVTDQFVQRRRTVDEPLPGPVVWGFLFAAITTVSMLANFGDPAVALMGMKSYFQMWVFFLGVVFLHWDKNFDRQLLVGLVLLALLQLPFAAHEYLVLMPRRYAYISEGVIPADVIAGTFGALALGGGANAVLAAYQIIIVGFLLAMWKNGVMGTFKTGVLSVLLLLPLVVNQARVSVLYVLLIFMVIFWRDIVRKPGKFFAASFGMAGLVAVLMTAIMLTHPGGALPSWSAVVKNVYAQQTVAVQQHEGRYELSRWSVLTFWAEQHVRANPVQTLLGHGPGASREPDDNAVLDVTDTLAQKKYPGLRIGYTGLSMLLWDTGVVGVICVLGMFASAFFMAVRLATHYRRQRDGFHTAMFEGLQAAMAVLTLSLAHKNYFASYVPYQAVVYLLIGFIANSSLLLVRRQVPEHEVRGV
jgi:hypothetical protein